MTPDQQGIVFAALMHYRTISDSPLGSRIVRRDEVEATQLLANCSRNELLDFEEFLNAQGLHLHSMDSLDVGVPYRPGAVNKVYVLTRQRGERLAPYFNSRWYIEAMQDQRRNSNKTETVFWFTRLWLTLQWFFYEKISRHPSQVSRYRDALVLSPLMAEVVEEGIERMGNAGRPDGEAGAMYDFFWKDRRNIRTWVTRFLNVMEQCQMIEETAVKGEFQQTLAAAVDMAYIADHELAYLMPPDSKEDVTSRSIMLVTGALLPANLSGEGNNAAHQ